MNTTDGSTTYDVAFALVWADGTSVTNSNSAYAFASCRQCKTIAVAFQVVLMTGDAHVAIPQNISGAVNYSCVQCLTYALAQQLVLTVPGELSPTTRQRLDTLWQQIDTFATTVQDLPLDEIRTRLLGYQSQIQALVTGEASTTTPSQGANPTTTTTTTSAWI